MTDKVLKHTINLLIASALFPFQAYSQPPVTENAAADSIHQVQIDSLFNVLKDTTSWNSEIDFVNSLNFRQPNDSDLIRQYTKELTSKKRPLDGLTTHQKDSVLVSAANRSASTTWEPNSRIATWAAILIPGGGQIYNHKYWKLPIIYGGYMGCIYALTWNGQMYKDYKTAYMDIMDNDPNTKSYEDMLPPGFDIENNTDWLKSVFKNRKDKFRRYRDMSIFAFAGVYIVSIIDAYVDAELSHFDISDDLSLQLSPGILDGSSGRSNLGLQVAITF